MRPRSLKLHRKCCCDSLRTLASRFEGHILEISKNESECASKVICKFTDHWLLQ